MAAHSATALEQLLFPLADCLRMDLEYKVKNQRVQGCQKFLLEIAPGFDMEVKVSVVASFANKAGMQAGVLAHIMGHLYLAVAYNDKKGTVTAWIVDSGALGVRRIDMVDIWPKDCSIKEAAGIVEEGVKKAFYRGVYDTAWKTVSFPKQDTQTRSRAGS